MWYRRPGAYNRLGSLSIFSSKVHVSFKHIRHSKHGKLHVQEEEQTNDSKSINQILVSEKEKKQKTRQLVTVIKTRMDVDEHS